MKKVVFSLNICLAIRHPGYPSKLGALPLTFTRLNVKSSPYEFVLKQAAVLEGNIRNTNGSKVTSGSVDVVHNVGHIDGDGFYRIENLLPGEHFISISVPCGDKIYCEREVQVNLGPGLNQLDLSVWNPEGPRAFIEELRGRYFNPND